MHLTAGFLVSNVQLCVFRQARGRQAWNSCVRNVKDCNGKSVTLMLVRWLSCSDSTAFIYSLYRFFHHGVTHTHTHTRLMVLCPGLPRWAGTREVKPIWILLKQETVSGSGISRAVCRSAPRSRQITMPTLHHSVFTGRMPFLPPNQQHQSTEGASIDNKTLIRIAAQRLDQWTDSNPNCRDRHWWSMHML